jgi:hypothetical protein
MADFAARLAGYVRLLTSSAFNAEMKLSAMALSNALSVLPIDG